MLAAAIDTPTPETRLLVALSVALYAAAAALAFTADAGRRRGVAAGASALLAGGIALNLAALVLRLAGGRPPTGSGFDALATLALLAGAAGMYFRAVRIAPLAARLLIPAAAVCELLAELFAGEVYRDFAGDVWNVAHAATAVAAAACFAAAAAGGALYLLKHRRLRRKDPAVLHHQLPSLERLERFVRRALPVGFVFVTAAIVTGLLGALGPRRQGFFHAWWTHPKVLFGAVAWLVYAAALHAASARRCRMRTAAVLAIAGFVLLVAVMLGSMLMPRPT